MLEYKGYIGHFAFDEEKLMFFGKVDNSHDFIIFQGKSVKEIKFAFKDAVDDYIAWCKRFRKEKSKDALNTKICERSEPARHEEIENF